MVDQYDTGYILIEDLPAERATPMLGGWLPWTSKKPVNALRGELLLAIPGEDLVLRNDGGEPHNYRLVKDSTVTLRAAEEEVAQLDRDDFLLLKAINSAHSRFDTYISADKLELGRSLKEGSKVFVIMKNQTEPYYPWLHSQAVVRWVGQLRGEKIFGLEIVVHNVVCLPVVHAAGICEIISDAGQSIGTFSAHLV